MKTMTKTTKTEKKTGLSYKGWMSSYVNSYGKGDLLGCRHLWSLQKTFASAKRWVKSKGGILKSLELGGNNWLDLPLNPQRLEMYSQHIIAVRLHWDVEGVDHSLVIAEITQSNERITSPEFDKAWDHGVYYTGDETHREHVLIN